MEDFLPRAEKRKKMCMKNRHQTQKKFWIKKSVCMRLKQKNRKKVVKQKMYKKKRAARTKRKKKSHYFSNYKKICIYAAFLFAFVMFWSPSNMSLKASLRHDHSNRRQKFYFKRKNGFNRLKTMDVIRKMNHKI